MRLSFSGHGERGCMDPRARRTQEALEHALLDILGEKPLKSITVTELCKRAGVTRAAFYGHYHDTTELIEQIKGRVLVDACDMVDRHIDEFKTGHTGGISADVFAYMDKRPELYSLLFGTYSEPCFLTTVIANSQKRYYEQIGRLVDGMEGAGSLQDAMRLQFTFTTSGFLYILKAWLIHDRRWPADVMARAAASLTGAVGPLPTQDCIDVISEAGDTYGRLSDQHDPSMKEMLDGATRLIDGLRSDED